MKFQQITLEKISHYLRDRKERISVAESVTSGLVQNAFSQMPLAEEFFEGGVTAYTIGQNVSLLNINFEEAEAVNCVSKSIAELMAINVAKLFSTQWSVSTTGYCTPVPKSGNAIYAYFAISYKDQIIVAKRINVDIQMKGEEAQFYFAQCVLSALQNEVKKLHPNLSINR